MSKHRVLWWIGIAIPVVVIVIFVSAAAVLHSKSFQTYALGKVIQSVEESTGAKVRVQSLDVNWHPLAIELVRNLRRQSRTPPTKLLYSQPIDLQVSLQVWPLLHHRVQIDSVTIDHPVIFVKTDSDGHNNLPTPPHRSNHRLRRWPFRSNT